MTLRTTRWSPDTHPGVEIDLEWDDAVPADERVHVPVAVRKDGKLRADRVGFHAKVLGENQRKNIAIGLLVEEVAGLKPEEIDFTVEADGTVALRSAKLPANRKAALRSKLQQRHGALVRLDD